MIVAFFESIKYVGHLVPVALLRIYFGYYFLVQAIEKYQGEFLLQPKLAAAISDFLPISSAPAWYKHLVDFAVVPNWQIFAYVITYCEFVIGLSLILGFFVRPVALIGAFLALNYVYTSSPEMAVLHELQVALFLTLGGLGAGRCLGFDYFFFKRQRGILW